MTNEGQTQQPAAGGRDAATQRLIDDYSRQCQELREELTAANQAVEYWQRKYTEAVGAAADGSDKAPLAPKTAFDSSAWLGELEAALVREEALKESVCGDSYSEWHRRCGRTEMLREIIDSERHSPNEKLTDRIRASRAPEPKL